MLLGSCNAGQCQGPFYVQAVSASLPCTAGVPFVAAVQRAMLFVGYTDDCVRMLLLSASQGCCVPVAWLCMTAPSLHCLQHIMHPCALSTVNDCGSDVDAASMGDAGACRTSGVYDASLSSLYSKWLWV